MTTSPAWKRSLDRRHPAAGLQAAGRQTGRELGRHGADAVPRDGRVARREHLPDEVGHAAGGGEGGVEEDAAEKGAEEAVDHLGREAVAGLEQVEQRAVPIGKDPVTGRDHRAPPEQDAGLVHDGPHIGDEGGPEV